MSAHSRRRFLQWGLGSGLGLTSFGGLSAFARLARASRPDVPSRYTIFCYFGGGWDVLLSLDPRNPAIFGNDRLSETRIQPGYMFLNDPGHPTSPFVTDSGLYLGPYIGDLADHHERLLVVRGMSMETLTHETGRRRFITGKVPAGLQARGSSGATWMAGAQETEAIVPNLSLGVESYNVDLPANYTALRVNGVPDLVRALAPGPSELEAREERQIDELLAQAASCPKAQSSPLWQIGESSRLGVQSMLDARLDTLFDFQHATDPDMEALRDHYGISASGNSALTTPEARAATAVTAITAGVSRAVSIRLTGGLDTHFNNWETDQGPTQERAFNAVARMVEDLASRPYGDSGDSWLDHTTIVGFSEFSRTPLLNGNGGRDHALMNACFLLGGGVRGGRSIGASSDVGMEPTTTNLMTGAPDPAGEIIKPEHIIRSLLYEAGVHEDIADLRVDPLHALFS